MKLKKSAQLNRSSLQIFGITKLQALCISIVLFATIFTSASIITTTYGEGTRPSETVFENSQTVEFNVTKPHRL